ncbi:unnamed protein product [Aureobasidium pullulans]|nr:unnamed protein product [Aureobasidium pullulans]
MSSQIIPHNKTVVLSTYRNLLRATRIAFQGDQSTLYNSRRFARDSFDKNRGVKAGSIEAEKAVEHAQGNRELTQTEKGDNESVKQFKGTTKSFAEVKRCSLI